MFATAPGVEHLRRRGDAPMRRGRSRLPRRPATHPVRAPRRVRPGAGDPPAARDAPGKRHGRRHVRRGESLREDHRPPPAERLAVPVGGGADVRGGGRVRGVDRGRDLRVPRAHAIRPRGAHGIRRRNHDPLETTPENSHRRSAGLERALERRFPGRVHRVVVPRDGAESRARRRLASARARLASARRERAKYAIVRRRIGGGRRDRRDPGWWGDGGNARARRGVVAAVRRRGGGRRRRGRGERPRTQGPRSPKPRRTCAG